MTNLNSVMDFDHVVEVLESGEVIHRTGIYAPEVYYEEVHPVGDLRQIRHPDGWAFLTGYSGQDRYSGPIMHSSEFIGGSMERDILETPGVYVAVVVYSLGEDPDESTEPDGWAVLRKV